MLISFDPSLETVETAACLESSIQTANTGFGTIDWKDASPNTGVLTSGCILGSVCIELSWQFSRFYSGVTTKLSAAISFLCLGHSAVLQS